MNTGYLLTFVDLFVFTANGLIVVNIIASWIPSIKRFAFVEAISGMADVVLTPARLVLPKNGMLDWSPLVTIFGLQILQSLLHRVL